MMKLFRSLDETEAAAFRAWARAHYQPGTPISGIWHPIVQTECTAMNTEAAAILAFLESSIID